MNCMYFNADSLLNKRNELKVMVGEQNPLVIGVTEVVPKTVKYKRRKQNCQTDEKLQVTDRLYLIYRSPNSNVTNDTKINYTLKKANNLGFSHVVIFGD